ncbi:MAG: hypothetical protein ACRDHW_06465, partial [Ktedonobacteraceae bacterium]
DEVLAFIQEHVPAAQLSNYLVVLCEFYENQYGGNSIIGVDGEIVIEMVRGSHAPLVSGEKTPEFFVRRNEFTGNLSYSFKNEALRKAVWNTLLTIPRYRSETSTDESDRYIRFTPGYYEFVLIKRRDTAPLEAIFLDYRSNGAYQLPASNASFPRDPMKSYHRE